jgi:hypothetical protein
MENNSFDTIPDAQESGNSLSPFTYGFLLDLIPPEFDLTVNIP